MVTTLYRAGFITPLSEVHNENAELFDAHCRALTGISPNRVASVYATPSLYECLDFWTEYRAGKGCDDTVYALYIPETLLTEGIYAYQVDLYEEFSQTLASCGEEEASHYAEDYMNSRIPLTEFMPSWLNEELSDEYEILIPHHLADQLVWNVVQEASAEDLREVA